MEAKLHDVHLHNLLHTGHHLQAPPPATATTYSCTQCPATFRTLTALRIHTTKNHLDRTNARYYARSGVCPACQVDFATRPRLIDHLTYKNTPCLNLLRLSMAPMTDELQQQLSAQDAKNIAALAAQGYSATKALVPANLTDKVSLPKARPLQPTRPQPNSDTTERLQLITPRHPHDNRQVQATIVFATTTSVTDVHKHTHATEEPSPHLNLRADLASLQQHTLSTLLQGALSAILYMLPPQTWSKEANQQRSEECPWGNPDITEQQSTLHLQHNRLARTAIILAACAWAHSTPFILSHTSDPHFWTLPSTLQLTRLPNAEVTQHPERHTTYLTLHAPQLRQRLSHQPTTVPQLLADWLSNTRPPTTATGTDHISDWLLNFTQPDDPYYTFDNALHLQ
jgi:hypothetical protein